MGVFHVVLGSDVGSIGLHLYFELWKGPSRLPYQIRRDGSGHVRSERWPDFEAVTSEAKTPNFDTPRSISPKSESDEEDVGWLGGSVVWWLDGVETLLAGMLSWVALAVPHWAAQNPHSVDLKAFLGLHFTCRVAAKGKLPMEVASFQQSCILATTIEIHSWIWPLTFFMSLNLGLGH